MTAAMCEVHTYRCPNCNLRWQGTRKLASCEDASPDARCPTNLIMFAGNPKKPRRRTCDGCARLQQMLEECGEDAAAATGGTRSGGSA